MSIITGTDGKEIWTKESYRVETWTVAFWDRKVEYRRSAEVEAYNISTAIDVAVDVAGLCLPAEVSERNRAFSITNIADQQAAVDAGEEYSPVLLTNDPVFADAL